MLLRKKKSKLLATLLSRVEERANHSSTPHIWRFVPEQIAWSREGTGLQSEIKLPETLEGPLRRFTEFERGEVKFSLIPQPTIARATFKKQQTL